MSYRLGRHHLPFKHRDTRTSCYLIEGTDLAVFADGKPRRWKLIAMITGEPAAKQWLKDTGLRLARFDTRGAAMRAFGAAAAISPPPAPAFPIQQTELPGGDIQLTRPDGITHIVKRAGNRWVIDADLGYAGVSQQSMISAVYYAAYQACHRQQRRRGDAR